MRFSHNLLALFVILFNVSAPAQTALSTCANEEKSILEQDDFKTFIKAGGKGTPVIFQGNFDGTEAKHRFLVVKKFPELDEASKNFVFQRDPDLLAKLNELLNSGVHILLADQNDHSGGAWISPPRDGMGKWANRCLFQESNLPVLTITAYIEKYSLLHELKHYSDMSSGLGNELITAIAKLGESGLLDKDDIWSLEHFVLEQRAYSLQWDAYSQDRTQKQVFLYLGGNEVQTTSPTEFDFVMSMQYLSGARDYARWLKPTLDKLKTTNETTYNEAKAYLRRYCSSSEKFGLEQQLPDHFTP